MAESLPGEPPRVHEGGNFAQPTATVSALPEGGHLERALSWSGRQKCGSPHGGDPQLLEVFETFDGQVVRGMSPDQAWRYRQLRCQFYDALMDD